MQHYYLASLRSQLDSWKAKVKFFTKVVDAKCFITDPMQHCNDFIGTFLQILLAKTL